MIEKNWNDLIKPRGLKIYYDDLTAEYGKFEAKPLERGYGLTIGNALRRILLSSIQGAAITAVKIEGVLHEFSTIKNVKEDVTNIILNLKEIRIKLTDKTETRIFLNVRGERHVTAADIEHDASVEILNPDLPIATLYGDDAHLKMEMIVKMGKGYDPVDSREKDTYDEVGLIPVDAFYSPIKKVNYDILNARVGQVTDYDRLVLEVWTDGTIKPDDAVAFAAKILKDQMTIFINFEEIDEISEEKPREDPNKKILDTLNKPVSELELSVRSANCLQNANIRFVGELVQKSEGEMLRTKNFGRKSLNEIKELITDMGLSLGMKVDDWKQPVEPPASEFPEDE